MPFNGASNDATDDDAAKALETFWPKVTSRSKEEVLVPNCTSLRAMKMNMLLVKEETKKRLNCGDWDHVDAMNDELSQLESLMSFCDRGVTVLVLENRKKRTEGVGEDDDDVQNFQSMLPRKGVKYELITQKEEFLERSTTSDVFVLIDDCYDLERTIEFIEMARKRVGNDRVFVLIENCNGDNEQVEREIYACLLVNVKTEDDRFLFCIGKKAETKASLPPVFGLGDDCSYSSSESDFDDDNNNNNNNRLKLMTINTNRATRNTINTNNSYKSNDDKEIIERCNVNVANCVRDICIKRSLKVAEQYSLLRSKIYETLKKRGRSNNNNKKSLSNDDPKLMSANASTRFSHKLVTKPLITKVATQAKEAGNSALDFLEYISNEETGTSPKKGLNYQNAADRARIKALESALRELNPDHPLLVFCPI